MKKIVASLLLFALCLGTSACATRKQHNAQLEARVGANISEVVEAWGEPTSKLTGVDGYTIYEWYKQETYSKLGMGEKNWCTNSFVVDPSGIIESASSRGNNCASEANRSFFVHF